MAQQHTPQPDPAWAGWKSVVLGIVLLYFIKPFGNVNQQQYVNSAPNSIQAEASVSQNKADVLIAILSDDKKSEILESIKWDTNENFPLNGDENAKKGGKLKQAANNFPPTIRVQGKDSSDAQLSMIQGLVYQTLVSYNPDPFYFYPSLANKWSVADDKKTFYYQIDEDAKWSDGNPVVAQDVVASWDFITSKALKAPTERAQWLKFERPVALSDKVVMVKSKTLHWKTFMTFSNGFFIYPAHELAKIDIKTYVKKYNWKMLTGSGPYKLKELRNPSKIIFERRKDFWGLYKRQYTGLFNFDTFEFLFVSDMELLWEKFKKGEFDFMPIYRSQRWVKELDFDKVKNGWIQKKRVFNRNPQGTQGYSFNIRKAPFNDKKVRMAMAYAYNRELLMEKLMYNQYDFMDSYYQNSPYMNKDVPKIRYDLEKARKLLAEAGWSEKNSDGILVKDGKPFVINFTYYSQWSEKFYTVYKESLEKVGIELNLKKITWATKIKETNERSFTLTSGAVTGTSFPDPELSYHSRFADLKGSNNKWGIKNSKVDKITEEYNKEFNYNKRVKLLQDLDIILANEYIMAFDWYAPAQRLVFWNKFGMPKTIIGKVGDYRDVPSMWWYEEDKNQALKDAMANGTQLEVTATDFYPYGKN
ncbi:MAG: ABC transporter substrate-binding protein [Candidatus Cloacimonetes bacterium]|nr:ABC transporter substrate-binding protein [Candidatus Cloacimonadota bacterium]